MSIAEARRILFIGMPVADILIDRQYANRFLRGEYGLTPGVRNLLHEGQIAPIETLLAGLDGIDVVAGGSMANTACTVARLCPDVSCSFFAVCADDRYGNIFTEAMTAANIQLLPTMRSGRETSRSYVVADEDGERAIARYFGDSMSEIAIEQLHEAIAGADIVLIEGELPALPGGYELWRNILAYAASKHIPVGFSLFGAEQVRRHHALFLETMHDHAHYVFGNEAELFALYEGHVVPEFETAAVEHADYVFSRAPQGVFCMSHGESIPYLHTEQGVFRQPPQPVPNVVNTLGAGDGFMGGVLAGMLSGLGGNESLSLGHKVAAAVIQQEGPQPDAQTLSGLMAA